MRRTIGVYGIFDQQEKTWIPEVVLCDGQCRTLDIGLYDGGRDSRVWLVDPV